MRRSRPAIVAAIVVGVAGFSAAGVIAGDSKRDFKTDMLGYEEVPAVSTTGNGQVNVEVATSTSARRASTAGSASSSARTWATARPAPRRARSPRRVSSPR